MSDITVTAEWALRGLAPDSHEHRLLSHSRGALSKANFEEVLARYSPGTPDSLPQVTISWLLDRRDGDSPTYLGLAIHAGMPSGDGAQEPDAAPDRPRGPGRGRQGVMTSYFCLPFGDLAAGAITYRALHEEFRGIRLPREPGDGLAVRLIRKEPEPPAAAIREPAMRAAAMLLTGRPVCVLGPLRTAERLSFLDATAALLPYGLRSRLSASTWASGTYESHRIRLFFASTARARDQVVDCSAPADGPIGDDVADTYLTWLRAGSTAERVAYLATMTRPLSFSPDDIVALPESLATSDERPPPAMPEALAWGTQRPRTPAPAARADPGSPDPEQLLRAVAREAADGLALSSVAALRERLGTPARPAEQAGYRRVIRAGRLLLAQQVPDPAAQAGLYEVLLPLAFPSPLTYEGFREIEKCAGTPPGQPVHAALLSVMAKGRIASTFVRPLVRLLLAHAQRVEPGGDATASLPPAESLIMLVTSAELLPQHVHLVRRVLLDLAGSLDQEGLRRHLPDVASRADEWQPDPAGQVATLSLLLRLAYGSPLPASAVRSLLAGAGAAPTASLIAAILISAPRSDRSLSALAEALVSGSTAAPRPPVTLRWERRARRR